MNSRQNQLQAFERLLDVMDDLREKCPWDKKQTMQTLRHLTIEETYELGDAILDNDLKDDNTIQFKKMFNFLKDNNLINDTKINKKNRLLAAYIGTNLALKKKPNISPNLIFTETFIQNAKSNSFSKLKENIELVGCILLA